MSSPEAKVLERPAIVKVGSQNEAKIKAKTLDHLIRTGRIGRDCVVASECSVPSLDVRADLAFLAESFTAIEIKGPRDSLRRLPDQINAYRLIFDHVIVVAASKHISKAMQRLHNVEVWEITSDYRFFIRQEPKGSVVPDRAAIRAALTRYSVRPQFRLEIDEREALLEEFRGKYLESSDRFWASARGKQINEAHIASLSRFRDVRDMQRVAAERKEQFWKSWTANASEFFGKPT